MPEFTPVNCIKEVTKTIHFTFQLAWEHEGIEDEVNIAKRMLRAFDGCRNQDNSIWPNSAFDSAMTVMWVKYGVMGDHPLNSELETAVKDTLRELSADWERDHTEEVEEEVEA